MLTCRRTLDQAPRARATSPGVSAKRRTSLPRDSLTADLADRAEVARLRKAVRRMCSPGGSRNQPRGSKLSCSTPDMCLHPTASHPTRRPALRPGAPSWRRHRTAAAVRRARPLRSPSTCCRRVRPPYRRLRPLRLRWNRPGRRRTRALRARARTCPPDRAASPCGELRAAGPELCLHRAGRGVASRRTGTQ
jgi:hypothetical protein